jgi:hypothetical protein
MDTTRFIGQTRTKKLLTLGLAPAFFMLALDAAIAHFAGKDVSHQAQWIPVGFGIAGGVGLGLVGLLRSSQRGFQIQRMVWRGIGGLSMAVGGAGMTFHLIPLAKDLADEPFSLAALEGALSVAPPLFAPGAFVALGALLIGLASSRLLVRLRTLVEHSAQVRSIQSRPLTTLVPVREAQAAHR